MGADGLLSDPLGGSGRRPDTVAVGLAGGIGAGKSTTLALFADMGALTISADRVVHDLYSSPEFATQVVEHLGPDILGGDGAVDRGALARRVKGDREGLRRLELLTHPLVKAEIEHFLATAPPEAVVVCEVPLLFESGFEALFDLIVTIEAGRENRVDRSSGRFDPAAFAEFEKLQASTERRVKGSDMAFFNDGTIEDLAGFVREAYARAEAILAAKISSGSA